MIVYSIFKSKYFSVSSSFSTLFVILFVFYVQVVPLFTKFSFVLSLSTLCTHTNTRTKFIYAGSTNKGRYFFSPILRSLIRENKKKKTLNTNAHASKTKHAAIVVICFSSAFPSRFSLFLSLYILFILRSVISHMWYSSLSNKIVELANRLSYLFGKLEKIKIDFSATISDDRNSNLLFVTYDDCLCNQLNNRILFFSSFLALKKSE